MDFFVGVQTPGQFHLDWSLFGGVEGSCRPDSCSQLQIHLHAEAGGAFLLQRPYWTLFNTNWSCSSNRGFSWFVVEVNRGLSIIHLQMIRPEAPACFK